MEGCRWQYKSLCPVGVASGQNSGGKCSLDCESLWRTARPGSVWEMVAPRAPLRPIASAEWIRSVACRQPWHGRPGPGFRPGGLSRLWTGTAWGSDRGAGSDPARLSATGPQTSRMVGVELGRYLHLVHPDPQ